MNKKIFRGWGFGLALMTLAAACGGSGGTKDARVKKGDEFAAQGKIPEALVEYRAALQMDPKDGLLRRKLGAGFVRVGDQKRALDQFVRAADLLPDDSDAQLDAARALLRSGQAEDAKTRAERVLKSDPKNVQALVIRAGAAFGLRDPNNAISTLEDAVKLAPGRAATYIELATLQATQGRAEAEAGFKQAILVAPKSIEARLALANYYWLTGRPKESEQAILGAVAIDSRDVRVNSALAGLYNLTGRAADAEAPLKRVVEVSQSLEPRLTLADYYVGQGRTADARKILEELAGRKDAAAAARSRLAGIEYDAGQTDAGHKMVDALIAEQPGNVPVMVIKGNWLLRERKLDRALVSAQAAVQADPKSPDALYLLGNVQMARNEDDEASKTFTELLQVQPDAHNAQIMLTNLNIARGRSDMAAQFAQQAVRIAPRDPAARHALARATFAQGRVDEALSEVRMVLSAVPDSPDALALLGRIQQVKGDAAGARQSYTRALKLAPSSAEALTGLVNVELAGKNYAAATRLAETSVASAPKNASLLLVAGRTYASAGEFTKAEAALRQAIDADPTLLEAYTAIGQVYIQQKKLPEALKTFEQRVKQRPNDVSANTMVGLLLYVQGKTADAKAQFEKTLAIDPRAAVAANNLAYMDADAGVNLDVALARAQIAKAAQPDDPDMNDTLGWVYVKRNLPALAVLPLEQAVQKDPNNPLYHYHLGVAHMKAEDAASARRSLERALQISSTFEGASEAKAALASLRR